MENNKDLEEANKEIERSKVDLYASKLDKQEEKEVSPSSETKDKEAHGSGIFTTDGKELPEIEGGYDIINPGGTMGDDDFVSS